MSGYYCNYDINNLGLMNLNVKKAGPPPPPAPLTFTFSSLATPADQTFTIQSTYATQGYSTVTIQCWGAGGGRIGTGNIGAYSTGCGGGGGYTSASFPLSFFGATPTNLTVIVGQAGQFGATTVASTYGGGGGQATGDGNWGTASGGGRSAVRLAAGTEIITAGGGGSAGGQSVNSTYTTPYGSGGAGGGSTGGNAYDTQANGGGQGGTQSAGGGGGTAGGAGSSGTAGSQYTGGGNTSGNYYGTAGGGGYYGGGQGAINNGVLGTWLFGGGGGGSSYVSPSGTLISMLQGNNWSNTTAGSKVLVGGENLLPVALQGGQIGYGAPTNYGNKGGAAGGNGYVIIIIS